MDTNKTLILEIIDELWDKFLKARARFPYLDDSIIGYQRVSMPSYYQNQGLDVMIDYGRQITKDDVTETNDVSHWINQNVPIRLYAILNSFQIIGDKIEIDYSIDGANELDLLR